MISKISKIFYDLLNKNAINFKIFIINMLLKYEFIYKSGVN